MERKKRSKCSGWECCYANKNFGDVWSRNESVRAEIGQILHTHSLTYGAPIQLKISPNQLEISTNRPILRYLQFNWRYLQFISRYLQIRHIWRYLQFNCRYLQFDKSDKISAPRRKNRCAMIQVNGLIKSCI